MLPNPFRWWRRRRRCKLLARAMPAAWAPVFERMPFWSKLAPGERDALRDKARILIAEKDWEGCQGLRIDDEIRVTIAAQAALLILNLDEDYAGVASILVYPNAFVNPLPHTTAAGVVSVGTALHGEAWRRGPVVLDWDATVRGAADGGDGRNLVFHEFAHKLDMIDGYAAGCPPLATRGEYGAWREVMTREFEALRAADAAGRATLLDRYGAVNPAEFFAVATEAFFEQGRSLRARHPELYGVLAAYYRQDPAGWS